VEANSKGGQGSRGAVEPRDDDEVPRRVGRRVYGTCTHCRNCDLSNATLGHCTRVYLDIREKSTNSNFIHFPHSSF
jgi:hypothetical protein